MTDSIKCHCNSCGHETKHDIIAARETSSSELLKEDDVPFAELRYQDTYEMLECRGCESVCVRHTNFFENANKTAVAFYPPPVSRHSPNWSHKLPKQLGELLDEVYVAVHNNCRRLAMIGTRTLLDEVMLQHVGDVGSFAQKLEAFEKRGMIGKANRNVLEAALGAGSAAAHRGYRATAEEIEAVMDIAENLLQAIYHLDHIAAELKKKIPPRKKTP